MCGFVTDEADARVCRYVIGFPAGTPTECGQFVGARPSKTWGCYGRPGHGTEGQNEVACRDGGDGCGDRRELGASYAAM